MLQAPEVLSRADGVAVLPRLGGMARPDGVVIASPFFWAMARTDGTLLEGQMPRGPRLLGHVPVLRGLVRLALAFAPLASPGGVAGRSERGILGVALLAPVATGLVREELQVGLGLLLVAALGAWIFRGRTLFLHGAEHRAIAACEQRSLAPTWEGRELPSRFSRRCGTNFAVLALAGTLLLYFLTPLAREAVWSLPLGLGVLGLTMELWLLIQAAPARASAFLLAPGLGLQRLTTREPAHEETRLALRAVASVLERELGRSAATSDGSPRPRRGRGLRER